jgi:4-hydroxy-tetrahydrodipicolinate synthase
MGMARQRITGTWAAIPTPLTAGGGLDAPMLGRFAAELLLRGCDGVALFGTTGEGPAFSVAERAAGLEAVLAAGVPSDRVIASVGCTALADVEALSRHALARGVVRLMMLPPFFFKGVGPDGVFAAFARTIDRLGDERMRLVLYHIPQTSAVAMPHAVIGRLAAAYPEIVVGIKDSSGDLDHTLGLIRAFPDLSVLVGAENHVAPAVGHGAAGTICGIANLAPQLIRRVCDMGDMARPEDLAKIDALIAVVAAGPFVPRVKAALAALSGHPQWSWVRPPLEPVAAEEGAALVAGLKATGLSAFDRERGGSRTEAALA